MLIVIIILVYFFSVFIVYDANKILSQFCNDYYYHMQKLELKFHEKQPKLW